MGSAPLERCLPPVSLDVNATLRTVAQRVAAQHVPASRGGARGPGDRTPQAVIHRSLEIQDLRGKVRRHRPRSLVVLCVDASESMAAAARLGAAKGAVLSLLTAAHVRRDRVALVAFEGERAWVVVPPTASVELARRRLPALCVGGATPLARGLLAAWRMVRQERVRDPQVEARLVLLSDGEANVPLVAGRPILAEVLVLCAAIRADGVHGVVLDTLAQAPGARPMRAIAEALGAVYHRVTALRAGMVADFCLAHQNCLDPYIMVQQPEREGISPCP